MNQFKGLLTLKKKKKEQYKSCQLSFIWVKWGQQPKDSLSGCSEKVGGKVGMYVILVKGDMSS